jgi:hypothetical protein
VLYTKYSSAAYQPFCARPVGRVLVRAVRVVCSPLPSLFSVRPYSHYASAVLFVL